MKRSTSSDGSDEDKKSEDDEPSLNLDKTKSNKETNKRKGP